MAALVLGLVLFLGLHSTRIFAEGWRTQTMESFGEKEYKLLYVLSVAGAMVNLWLLARFAGWLPPRRAP